MTQDRSETARRGGRPPMIAPYFVHYEDPPGVHTHRSAVRSADAGRPLPPRDVSQVELGGIRWFPVTGTFIIQMRLMAFYQQLKLTREGPFNRLPIRDICGKFLDLVNVVIVSSGAPHKLVESMQVIETGWVDGLHPDLAKFRK